MIDKSFNFRNKTLHVNRFSRFFGDKNFIKLLLRLFIPAALQSLISIAVLYVDNFSLATLINDPIKANAAKDALGLANPLINFVIFVMIGWIGCTGIMISQYFGNNDTLSVKKNLSFRIWSITLLQLPMAILFLIIPGKLIQLVSSVETGLTFELAKIYLFYTTITFIFTAISFALSFALQETKRAGISFISSILGMATNIILDPIVIIFSKDVETAVMLVALSTGLARIIQILFILMYILVKRDSYLFFFKSWNIELSEIWKIIRNGCAVLINDVMYAVGNMILMVCLLVYNPSIHNATTNLMLIIQFTTIVWPGMASASAILVGSELGANRIKSAIHNSYLLMVWGIIIASFLGILLFVLAIFVNSILSPNASQEILILSRNLEWIMSPILISQGISCITYYAIRSGGSKIVFAIDGGIMIIWVIMMSAITFTGAAKNFDPLLYVFLLESNQLARMVLGLIVFKYYKWAKTLTSEQINISASSLYLE